MYFKNNIVLPDIEVNFIFYHSRKIYQGYKPSHLIKDNYLTTGIHYYYSDCTSNIIEVQGTITFVSPECYPNTLWVGKRIEMFDGSLNIGYAIVTKIFNLILSSL